MSNKLILQDLANALTAQSKQPKKINETFVRAFFETIEESLEKERFVKIKGWGTFKLIAIGERESININTGERFQIGGHYKISFVPETKLKETINKPFSHFQTITLNDKVTVADLEAADEEENLVPTEEDVEQPIEPSSTDLQNSQETENTTLNPSTQESVKTTDSFPILEEDSNAQFASEVHDDSTDKSEDSSQANIENKADKIATESEEIQSTIVEKTLDEQPRANIDDPEETAATRNEGNTDCTCHTTEAPSQVADEVPPGNNTLKDNNSTKGPIEIKITEFPAISFVRPWYKILIGICIVVALCLGYLIGFFRLVGPKQTTKIKTERIVVRDTTLANFRKTNSTTTIATQETSQQLDTISQKGENKRVKKTKNASDASSSGQTKSQSTVISYRVKRGESLHDISRKFYHSDKYVNMIIKYNHITNPDRIVYDTVLQIPPLNKTGRTN